MLAVTLGGCSKRDSSFDNHTDTNFANLQPLQACGGFHPDFCLEWQDGDATYQVLICFGCYEVKCYGPRTELWCDIQESAYDQFKKVLRKYRKSRPAPVGNQLPYQQ